MRTHKKKIRKILTPEQKIKRRNFISFLTFFILGGAAFGAWKWLLQAPEETPGVTAGASKPLRRALNKTELFFRNLFSHNHLARTYAPERAAADVRVNGDIGIEDEDFDQENWRLSILNGKKEILKVNMVDIRQLPKTAIVFDFKCVEGWDQIQHWAGVRFTDFIAHYKLQEEAKMQYVGMQTPDGAYYVGLDMDSALHPQTLLAYEMNGQPITPEHGAPLRLIIPVKYGIKNLKRIGTITFGNQRPPDYWAEQGYDYYSGL
ncbi:molybdopterin-dependent oxidoreductase [Chitinophaga filiformis]|uniref:Molybdopterin-dependent oxidoreductase n=1 Tax=Chitinophaga filiformis TaxID=104663 RepID=A0ABY4I9I2_CHIFI|nr:molybdopterin-dependent oxidoreductase [Chitinophaga filiformis]UPK72024.1 molybdopterin-dependent oxidoreductase [Chitinophaga filiformis]